MPAEFDRSGRLVALAAEQRWPQKLTYVRLSHAQFRPGSLGDKNFRDSLEGKLRPKHLFTQPAGNIFHPERMKPTSPVLNWINQHPDLTVAELLQTTAFELRQQAGKGTQNIDNATWSFMRNFLVYTPYYLLVHDICRRHKALKTTLAAEAEYIQAVEVTKALGRIEPDEALILRLKYGIPAWNPLSPAEIASVSGSAPGDISASLRKASRQIEPHIEGYAVNEPWSIARRLNLSFRKELEVFPDCSVGDVLTAEDIESLGFSSQYDIPSILKSNFRIFAGERDLLSPDQVNSPEAFVRFNPVIEKIRRTCEVI